jgi:dTDP-4-dehydrorhamnose reductase
MRLLILGAGGQLGGELVAQARRHPGVEEVTPAARSDPEPSRRADLRDKSSVDDVIVAARPTHVILAAAATNVAWCEANQAEARRINVDGTSTVASACRRSGARLTFFSTDYVFDGTAGPYPESALPHPINAYGAQKLEAEEIVLDQDARNLVIRTCQVFGNDVQRRNYVLRVADQLQAGETVRAATDLYGTPTFAADLAETLLALLQREASGLWHVAGESNLSRFELARMVALAFGADPQHVLETSADAIRDGVARPRMAGLRTERADTERPPMTPLATAISILAELDQPQGAPR